MASSDSKWIPLESNPIVMNAWSSKLGLDTDKFQFDDVFGLDDELLAFVRQPVKALVLCFPDTAEVREKRLQAASLITVETNPPTVFIKQTIRNACGTMALLHALGNAGAEIKPGTTLAEFFEKCKDKTPQERAQLLKETELFASTHAEQASAGQSSIPANLDVDFHYSAFVHVNVAETGETRLVELDGRLDSPLDHGPSVDLLRDVATVLRSVYLPLGPSINFNLMSLGPPDS